MFINDPQRLIVERSISVPAERAFAAWADAGQLSTWFITDARQDVRVGGQYSNAANDRGEYLEVVPGRRLRFTWDNPKHSPGTEVSIEFDPVADDVTNVRLIHDRLVGLDAQAVMSEGWEWALDSMKSYLETGDPISYDDWRSRKEMGV